MSKIAKAIKRFEHIRVGVDERKLGTDKKPIGDDTRPNIRVVGIDGKEMLEFMDFIDKKDTKGSLKFITFNALKRDDPTTTEADFDNADMADLLAIANVRTKLSGLGEMFSQEQGKKGVENSITPSERQSRVVSLREKLETGQM